MHLTHASLQGILSGSVVLGHGHSGSSSHPPTVEGRALRAHPLCRAVEPGCGRSHAARAGRLCRMLSPYRISWAALLEAANFQAA
jgi:hypothetical protein